MSFSGASRSAPVMIRQKLGGFEATKNQKKEHRLTRDDSCGWAGNVLSMALLRKKILSFRDIIDLPPCDARNPMKELIMGTVGDLHKLYPKIVPSISMSEVDETTVHEVFTQFYNALKSIGDSWAKNQKWLSKFSYETEDSNIEDISLEKFIERVLDKLDYMIKVAKEIFDVMDEEDQKEQSPQNSVFGATLSTSYTDNKTLCCLSPVTPTSVLPEIIDSSIANGKFADYSYSPPLLWPLRLQAVGKLKSVDVKRLSFHMQPSISSPRSPNPKKQMIKKANEVQSNIRESKTNSAALPIAATKEDPKDSKDAKGKSKILKSKSNEIKSNKDNGANSSKGLNITKRSNEIKNNKDNGANTSKRLDITRRSNEMKSNKVNSANSSKRVDITRGSKVLTRAPLPPPPVPSAKVSAARPPVPSAKVSAAPPPVPSVKVSAAPPPPPPMLAVNVSAPPPPPAPMLALNASAAPPPLPPPMLAVNVSAPPAPMLALNVSAAPPPPMVAVKASAAAPPPPPPPPPMVAVKVSAPSPPPPMVAVNVSAVAAPPPPPPPMVAVNASATPPPPPPPPTVAVNASAAPPPPPPPTVAVNASAAPPPPPPPMVTVKVSAAPPPPPPMFPKNSSAPPPPPPMLTSKGFVPLPPPPMSMGPGGGPPPPPAAKALRPKKANTKLKRSTNMGNLYRLLKGKVEGSSLDGKSSNGKKSQMGGSSGGSKQSMADALAEMTKRSSYFQQIEEDVEKHAKSIMEMKSAISSFQTKDMAELLKFHQYVEQHLECLTDESQVLARFEDFPNKKLETLRTAAALYLKLNAILTNLESWKIEAPLNQLLEKVESYFNKIKGELDTLERTKDDEAKRFQSNNIHFDFSILVKIKETIVDVSSGCMELALKERRQVKAATNGEIGSKAENQLKACAKMLWRAFQLAFRVYTFAGGQDDRAERLTKELAHEIETDPQN